MDVTIPIFCIFLTIIFFPPITTDGKSQNNDVEYHGSDKISTDEHERHERAVDQNTIIMITRQRRKKIVKCCGYRKCTEGREPTEGTTTSTTTTTTATTTTRCTPPCPTCVDRNFALWNSYGNLIDKDSYGTWAESCSRTYLFSKTTANYAAANAVCCSLGMYFLSVPTAVERKCLHDANNALATAVSGKFLTSAWRDTCPEYTWCFGPAPMIENIWMASSGDPHGGDESCAVLTIAQGDPQPQALEDVKCDVPATFACEGPITTCAPECPVTADCTTDYSLYAVDGELTTPTSVGIWKIPTGATCETNKMYLFSTITKSYADAGKFCCSIGMKLLSIETPGEHQCITDLNNADMKLADNFWTSGGGFNCKSKDRYKWCAVDTKIYDAIPWGLSQPNFGPNEWCAELVLKTGADADSTLSDFDCAAPKKFICEGPPTTSTTCATPTCTDIPCDIDPNAFIPEGGIKAPDKYGKFYSICGFNYLFSTAMATYCSARKACCRLGMQLVSLDTRANQIDCIYDFNNDTSKLTGPHYVNAISATKLAGFKWCPSTNFIEYIWITGEPQDTAVPQLGTTILLDSRVTGRDAILAGSAVTTLQKFICEEQQPVPPLCTESVCPTIPCITDQYNFYNLDGTLKNPGAHGNFKVCNDKLYMFSWPTRNYQDALKYCCAIGMKLVSFETSAEAVCLNTLNGADMKYGLQFWSSGTQSKCYQKYRWCGENVVFSKGDFSWSADDPNNYHYNKLCVLQNYSPTAAMTLSDEKCAVVKNFVCEGPTTTTTTCATPTCADPPCTKDASIFDASGALIAPFKFGTFITACGGSYMFNPAGQYNWCQARTICCRLGMKLIGIETVAENDCLFNLVTSGNITSAPYWTSGLSSTVLTGFNWCSSNTAFDITLWKAGSPSNNSPGKPENVVFFTLDNRAVGTRNTFEDIFPSYSSLGVACEA